MSAPTSTDTYVSRLKFPNLILSKENEYKMTYALEDFKHQCSPA